MTVAALGTICNGALTIVRSPSEYRIVEYFAALPALAKTTADGVIE
jgi:hypothetical protein